MITIARCVSTDCRCIFRTRYQAKSNRRCRPIIQIMRCHAHRQSPTHSSAHRKASKTNSQSSLSSHRALQSKPLVGTTPDAAARKARASFRDDDRDLAWVRSCTNPTKSDSFTGSEGSSESVSKSLATEEREEKGEIRRKGKVDEWMW